MSENKLLELTNDIVFQKIFGDPKNKDITKHFLSILLDKNIKNINLDANQEAMNDAKNDEIGITKVQARMKRKDFDIEIHVKNNFDDTTINMLIYRYAEKSENAYSYLDVAPSIYILIANYLLKETDGITKYYNKGYISVDDCVNMILTDALQFHILELPKVNGVDIKTDELALWLQFIANPNNMEVRHEMEERKNKYLKQLFVELENLSNDLEFKKLLEKREEFLKTQS